MKKKTIANLIMVVIIVAIAAGGCLLALGMRESDDTGIGSAYQTPQFADNALITAGQEGNLCTITIVCHTVLDNLDRLDEGKMPYIPGNGVILPTTTVSYADGDTVFQVLQKVCTAGEIPLEYSWTPLYDSYYVEGINHLYEFDCGFESGWMYQVNGVYPNYGCSSYKLSGGEDIVWCYTCVGLGKDVGQTWIEEE